MLSCDESFLSGNLTSLDALAMSWYCSQISKHISLLTNDSITYSWDRHDCGCGDVNGNDGAEVLFEAVVDDEASVRPMEFQYGRNRTTGPLPTDKVDIT